MVLAVLRVAEVRAAKVRADHHHHAIRYPVLLRGGPDRLLRLRVGGWRIVMHDADRLEILHIASRGSAYTE